MAEDSGKTIEFYVPKQLLGNPEKIAITAKNLLPKPMRAKILQ